MAHERGRRETALNSIAGGYGMERGEAYYRRHLHVRSLQRTFGNQEVLDLGASADLNFASTLKKARVTPARLVSLSPAFSSEMILNKATAAKTEAGLDTELVAGMGEKLPFADGTFTRTVVVNVAEHLIHPGQFEEVCAESIRVLKAGGKTFWSPITMKGDMVLIPTEDPSVRRELSLPQFAARFPGVRFKFEREQGSRMPKSKQRSGALRIEKSQ